MGKTYGQNCSEVCGHCLKKALCDVVDGTCDACEAGYQGRLCKTECTNRTFGINCDLECGHCKNNDPCNIKTGECVTGCSDGYRGTACIKACTSGTYGPDCSKYCAQCFENKPCNISTGICEAGCAPGFIGALCNKSTNVAYKSDVAMSSVLSWTGWGPDNVVDGRVPKDQNSHTCQCCASTLEELNPWLRIDFGNIYRLFSINIIWESSQGVVNTDINIYLHNSTNDYNAIVTTEEEESDIYNKTFARPVKARYLTLVYLGFRQLAVCELQVFSGECRQGTYGAMCEHDCHCAGPTCDAETGYCPSGICLPGYSGYRCDQACPNGTYGENCRNRCGACLYNAPCDHVNGTCRQCEEGYTGHTCTEDSSSKKTYGVIIGGIMGTLFLLVIVIIVVILYRKRVRAQNNEQQTYESFGLDTRHQVDKSAYATLQVPGSS